MKLEKWQWTSLLLCGYGLFKEFRPSEPFLVAYILSYKNVTQDEVVHKAFPSYTYTYLATLAVVFLVTDYFRYRPVIILEGVCYVCTWIVLTWGQGLISILLMEFFYGIVSSTEVAYFTYIYAKVDREHYAKATSYTYSAILVGRFFGSIIGQLLVQFDLMNYHELNYLSLASVTVALIFALCLPRVTQSIYFHRKLCPSPNTPDPLTKETFTKKVKNTTGYMWEDFKSAFGNSYVLKWSVWWTVATAGNLQVINFIQALWETIVTENGSGTQDYNGYVEACHTLLSSIMAFGVGYVNISWKTYGDTFLAFSAVFQAAVLVWMSKTESLYVAYVCFIVFKFIFQVIMTIASAEVAQKISEDSFGLIFGINTFAALLLQTILTVVVADDAGLSLNLRDQFLIYGIWFGALGAAFFLVFISSFVHRCTRHTANKNNGGIIKSSS